MTFDFYRDIHKGIRGELFAVTHAAGTVDPGNAEAIAAVATRWRNLSGMLVTHADHEEVYVQPVVEEHAPHLAGEIIPAHRELEARAAALEVLADHAVDACPADARLETHRLYLGLAGFTSAYMVHQEFEELEVMPALSAAVGVDELIAIDMAIVSSLPLEDMVYSATLMLPAMNIEDRVELVGGMQEGMPADMFGGVLGLVESLLPSDDFGQLRTAPRHRVAPPVFRRATGSWVTQRALDCRLLASGDGGCRYGDDAGSRQRGATVADKSPKKDNAKKAGKSLKEKRAEKNMKKQGNRPIGS